HGIAGGAGIRDEDAVSKRPDAYAVAGDHVALRCCGCPNSVVKCADADGNSAAAIGQRGCAHRVYADEVAHHVVLAGVRGGDHDAKARVTGHEVALEGVASAI